RVRGCLSGRGHAHRQRLVRRPQHAEADGGDVLEERAVRYTCCDERRLRAVKEAGVLNGIEYVEGYDEGPPPPDDPLHQRGLYVRLLKPPAGLTPEVNVRIEGGERIRTVVASTPTAAEQTTLSADLDDPSTVLLVKTDSTGDFSLYTLRLVAGAG